MAAQSNGATHIMEDSHKGNQGNQVT